MNENPVAAVGKFEAYEILDTSALEKVLSISRFASQLNLAASESEFLRRTLEKGRVAIIIVADRGGGVRFILTALYSTFRILLTFLPQGDISISDLYSICDLRATFKASPHALDVMRKSLGKSFDFCGRVSRLLNINFYLARGVERQNSFYDMIEEAVKFAENVSFLSGAELTVEPECPNPAIFDRFDCALLGLFLVEAIAKSAESSDLSVHLRFITNKESKPFVCISLAGEPARYDALAVSIMRRLNVPIKLVPSKKGTKILVCPLRPDLSLMELKQRLALLKFTRTEQTDVDFPE